MITPPSYFLKKRRDSCSNYFRLLTPQYWTQIFTTTCTWVDRALLLFKQVTFRRLFVHSLSTLALQSKLIANRTEPTPRDRQRYCKKGGGGGGGVGMGEIRCIAKKRRDGLVPFHTTSDGMQNTVHSTQCRKSAQWKSSLVVYELK